MGRGRQRAKERAAAAQRRATAAAQRVPRTPSYPSDYKETESVAFREAQKFRESRSSPINEAKETIKEIVKQVKGSEDLPKVETPNIKNKFEIDEFFQNIFN